jgi:membrane protein implicated in regulation of membrane protease activity
MAADTSGLRGLKAEQHTWLAMRLWFIGIVIALFLAWQWYEIAKQKRARLAKKAARDVGKSATRPRQLPRQRRRP